MYNNNADLMEEWKSLRQEVARKQSFVERLVLTTIAGNLAIYSFAFSLQSHYPIDAVVALLPIILSAMSYFWILRSLYSVQRITKYIKDRIEPHTGLNWESWLLLTRSRMQTDGKIKLRENIFGVFYHTFFSLSIVVAITLIWLPHCQYDSNASQSNGASVSQVPPMQVNTYWTATIVFIILCASLYLIVEWLWIRPRIRDMVRLNQELQELSPFKKFMKITNKKIEALEPRWAPFKGFSLLFDNPGSSLLQTSELVPEGLSMLKSPTDTDEELQLYKGFTRALKQIGGDILTCTYSFCPLPPHSYHVTVWDGLNDDNVRDVDDEYRAALEDFLKNLPHSMLKDKVFTSEICNSALLEATNRPIRFEFDQLGIRGHQALVARLKPVDDDSEDELNRIVEARKRLCQSFKQRFKVRIGMDYSPHVSLGYFADVQYSRLATSQKDAWTRQFKMEVEESTITFRSIGLYGFTDMVTFFKGTNPPE